MLDLQYNKEAELKTIAKSNEENYIVRDNYYKYIEGWLRTIYNDREVNI